MHTYLAGGGMIICSVGSVSFSLFFCHPAFFPFFSFFPFCHYSCYFWYMRIYLVVPQHGRIRYPNRGSGTLGERTGWLNLRILFGNMLRSSREFEDVHL